MKKYVKKFYYQNVKPNIDKVMSNPGYFIPTGNILLDTPRILGAVGSYFYRPDFDARKAKTKDEAYEMARSTGAKTFIWNGDRYNTDYKGNPKKTLVQQKQEELDTYGITNEQTQNKNKFTNNFMNTVSFRSGYNSPVGTVVNTLLNRKNANRNIEDKYKNKSTFLKEHEDATRLLFGYPQIHDTYKISDYKPSNSEQDYYLAYKNRNPITEKVGYNLDDKAIKNKFRETRGVYSEDNFNEFTMKHLVDTPRDISKLKIGNNQIGSDTSMGQFTIGKTNDYHSYYDKWDLNPFGSGNDKPLMELGKPLNIYDRKYFKKQGGNINYTSQFKLGGAAKILQTGGTSPNPWFKERGQKNNNK